MSTRTPLSRARGLGSAHSGVHHFWVQRLTAVALIPLVVWFTASVAYMSGADFETVRGFFAQPVAAVLTFLLIAAGAYHMQLGLQVIIEDYIHTESTKIALLMLNTFFSATVGLIAALAVLKLAVAG